MINHQAYRSCHYPHASSSSSQALGGWIDLRPGHPGPIPEAERPIGAAPRKRGAPARVAPRRVGVGWAESELEDGPPQSEVVLLVFRMWDRSPRDRS